MPQAIGRRRRPSRVSSAGKGYGGILLFVALAAGIGALFAFLAWWRFTYAIGADEIVIEKGLLQRQRRVIPFDRVQDIAIEQTLLARLFGTAKVKIETGGSGGRRRQPRHDRARRRAGAARSCRAAG